MASRIQPLITVAELDACPDDGNRYELIEGELFVSRAARLPHQLVLHNLQVALASYLKQNPIGKVVPSPGAVFSDYDAVIPDLVFVKNESWDRIVADERFVKAPDLVIEILSPGKQNRERDVLIKRQLYSRYGVEEYWIVDPEKREIAIYRKLEESLQTVSTVREPETVTSLTLPGLELDLQTIFDR
ncbi:MAG: Uma2 family endonuclease [Pyrinomonadaceae bacterium]